jgi:SAM-dependent methyltransferase
MEYKYLMENDEEEKRLDIKTDPNALKAQAQWCGISPGARLLDVGCGPGKTTALLHELVGPDGEAVGVDLSEKRINYALKNYAGKPGIKFYIKDFSLPMNELGSFDFIWMRFVLEYYREGAADIIRNVSDNLKPGGWLCLIDIDYNGLNQWGMPAIMEDIIARAMRRVQNTYNFDPFIGRKLYAHLYDEGFQDISLNLMAHHLIYGELNGPDEFNWMKKIEIALEKVPDIFESYPGGSRKFLNDFMKSFRDPRRFTYTPLILCRGRKPLPRAG